MKFLILITLLTLSSCASYVNQIHRQIDREERVKQSSQQRSAYPTYGQYNNPNSNRRDARPIQNPVTLGGAANSNDTRNLPPQVQREYGRRRTNADDLKDNEPNSSLWAGKNSESFLFVTNNIKRNGDIVIVEVLNELKDQIQEELKRTFPASIRNKEDPQSSTTGDSAPKAEESVKDGSEEKVYDKISTQVVEEVNADYLLIRGRKEVMYQKIKRFIEIQALVSRKDISSTDAVKSTKVLEPKITVLRY